MKMLDPKYNICTCAHQKVLNAVSKTHTKMITMYQLVYDKDIYLYDICIKDMIYN